MIFFSPGGHRAVSRMEEAFSKYRVSEWAHASSERWGKTIPCRAFLSAPPKSLVHLRPGPRTSREVGTDGEQGWGPRPLPDLPASELTARCRRKALAGSSWEGVPALSWPGVWQVQPHLLASPGRACSRRSEEEVEAQRGRGHSRELSGSLESRLEKASLVT